MNIQLTGIYAPISIGIIAVVLIIVTIIFFKMKKNIKFKKGDLEVELNNEENKSGTGEELYKNIINNKNEVSPPPDFNIRSLTEHHIFSYLKKVIELDLDNIEIENPLKKLIVTSFLKIKFSISYDVLKEIIQETESKISSGGLIIIEDIWNKYIAGIDLANKTSKEQNLIYEGKIIPGVPEIFITNFKKWHEPHLNLLYESVSSIISNNLYPSEKIKLISIIEIFSLVMKLTIEDALTAKEKLNGHLEKAIKKYLEE